MMCIRTMAVVLLFAFPLVGNAQDRRLWVEDKNHLGREAVAAPYVLQEYFGVLKQLDADLDRVLREARSAPPSRGTLEFQQRRGNVFSTESTAGHPNWKSLPTPSLFTFQGAFQESPGEGLARFTSTEFTGIEGSERKPAASRCYGTLAMGLNIYVERGQTSADGTSCDGTAYRNLMTGHGIHPAYAATVIGGPAMMSWHITQQIRADAGGLSRGMGENFFNPEASRKLVPVSASVQESKGTKTYTFQFGFVRSDSDEIDMGCLYKDEVVIETASGYAVRSYVRTDLANVRDSLVPVSRKWTTMRHEPTDSGGVSRLALVWIESGEEDYLLSRKSPGSQEYESKVDEPSSQRSEVLFHSATPTERIANEEFSFGGWSIDQIRSQFAGKLTQRMD